MPKKMTDEQILAQLNPKKFRAKVPDQDLDPLGRCRIDVTIDQLVPYDGNPRQSKNPRYEEIKESIRHQGLRNKFTLTRRSPDDDKFMIMDGGNTRLKILKELWEETGDERFYRLEQVEFYPWTSETDILARHMSENENRGNMLFIEKAHAAKRLKEHIEAEAGESLSHRDLAKKITEKGWTLDQPKLGIYLYTLEYLEEPLHGMFWNRGAGAPAVRKIRTIANRYLAFAKSKEMEEDEFYSLLAEALRVVEESEYSMNKEAEEILIDQLDRQLGAALGMDHGDVNIAALRFGLRSSGAGLKDVSGEIPPARVPALRSVSGPGDVPRENMGAETPQPAPPSSEKKFEARPRFDPAREIQDIWKENRDIATRLLEQFGIEVDFYPVDFGAGFYFRLRGEIKGFEKQEKIGPSWARSEDMQDVMPWICFELFNVFMAAMLLHSEIHLTRHQGVEDVLESAWEIARAFAAVVDDPKEGFIRFILHSPEIRGGLANLKAINTDDNLKEVSLSLDTLKKNLERLAICFWSMPEAWKHRKLREKNGRKSS